MRCLTYCLPILGLGLLSAPALAEQSYCDSPWLQVGKQISGRYTGAGAGHNQFTVKVLELQRTDQNRCQAQLAVSLVVSYLGLPVNASGRLNLSAHAGGSSLQGNLQSTDFGGLSLQTELQVVSQNMYLLKPMNLVQAGQSDSLAELSANARGRLLPAPGLPQIGYLNTQNTSFSRTTARVSALSQQQTALGTQQCQHIQYQASASGGKFSSNLFKSNPKRIEAIQVTDTYCPALGLVTKSTYSVGGQPYTLEITAIQ